MEREAAAAAAADAEAPSGEAAAAAGIDEEAADTDEASEAARAEAAAGAAAARAAAAPAKAAGAAAVMGVPSVWRGKAVPVAKWAKNLYCEVAKNCRSNASKKRLRIMRELMHHLFEQDVSYCLAYGDDPRVTRAGLITVYITPLGFVAVDVSPSLMGNAAIMQLVQQLVQLAYSELRPDSDLVFASDNPASLTVDGIPAPEAVRGGGRLAAVEAIRKVAAFLAMDLEDGVAPEGE
jgi:hypothetical protein